MNKSQANIIEDSEYSIILVINNSYTIIKITLDFGLSVLGSLALYSLQLHLQMRQFHRLNQICYLYNQQIIVRDFLSKIS